jgi:hypothetical protein
MPLGASADLTDDLPPVGDQGNQPSCVGWSTGYYCKTWWEKQENPGWDLGEENYQFSPSFIFNQVGGPYGASLYDALELLRETGDVDVSEFPYNDRDFSAQPTAAQNQAAKQYLIKEWKYFFVQAGWGVYNRPDVTGELKSWLDSGKPIVMGIPVFDDFPDYSNGSNMNPVSRYYDSEYGLSNPPSFQSPTQGGNFWGGHAVFIGGYDDNAGGPGRGGFLMVNSWGPGWNADGEVYLGYDFVQECVPEAWAITADRSSSPAISSITPSSALGGTTVTVKGNNFGTGRRSARITFPIGSGSDADRERAQVKSWTNNQIKAVVPSDAGVGDVYVYDWNGERSGGGPFSGTPSSTGWMMAEGATWPGFGEWVLVQNPNKEDAVVKLRFLTPEGPIEGPTFELPGESRMTTNVNELVPNRDVATVVMVENGVPVCAERAMYVSTSDGKWGSHDSVGSPTVSQNWYLAEGATWPGYEEWVLVMNPFDDPVSARITFQTPPGEVEGPLLELAPGSRQSVHVNQYVPDQDVSTRVECLTSGYGIVAERSMYINTVDGKLGCHNSMGCQETGAGWGLAEGATWPGYEEWVLVQNPTAARADVEFYFLTPEGIWDGPVFSVDPGTRASIRVNDYLPGRDVSTLVFTLEENQEIVVERAMYVAAADGKRGAHNSTASAYMGSSWHLPEGATWPGFDEWVLVMNPDPEEPVNVRLTLMTPDGALPGPSATLEKGTRQTFHINDYYTGDVSVRVQSDGYVVCERSMYVATHDGKNGSHCSMGVLHTDVTAGAAAIDGGNVERFRSTARPLP